MSTSKLYNLVRISMRQCMSSLCVFSHKLVTPSSTIDTTMAFPVRVNPSFLIGFAGVHLVRLCHCQCEVHHKRIMNVILLLSSSSSVLKSNELQRYITVMHVLSLGSLFRCFHVCFRSKHSELFSG